MSTIKIIKVNATRSTNDKVKMLIKSKKISNKTILSANYQYGGRGQYNNRWYSSNRKNLLCSLYIDFPAIKINNSFVINCAVSLAVLKTIKNYEKSNTVIKWPNDILSGNKKISGILIENIINNNSISHSIIGVGINVNQLIFRNLSSATSIKKLSGKHINTDEILKKLIENYNYYFSKIQMFKLLLNEYNDNLYGRDECNFILKGKSIKGRVNQVKEDGKIEIISDMTGKEKYSSDKIKIIF